MSKKGRLRLLESVRRGTSRHVLSWFLVFRFALFFYVAVLERL